MVSSRQEISHIRRHHAKHALRAGDTVTYFEQIDFGDDPDEDSSYDHVYGEPALGVGGRRFKPGVTVRLTNQVIEVEDDRRDIPDGRQTTQVVQMTADYKMMLDVGITEPWDSPRHLRDVVFVDGRYYQLHSYRIVGRVQDEVAVLMRGHEVFLGQDLPNDPGPAIPTTTQFTWPTSLSTP